MEGFRNGNKSNERSKINGNQIKGDINNNHEKEVKQNWRPDTENQKMQHKNEDEQDYSLRKNNMNEEVNSTPKQNHQWTKYETYTPSQIRRPKWAQRQSTIRSR